MSILPAARPRATRWQVHAAASHAWRDMLEISGPLPEMFVAGVPAYYRDSMGRAGANDRSIYDDAFFVFGPGGTFVPFNGNTDPSIYRDKVATLVCPQLIWYRPGIHALGKKSQHAAFRQDSPVIVRRDDHVQPKGTLDPDWGISLGGGLWTDAGFPERFWTNNHRGGHDRTSSLGCLTVPPSQWDAYHAIVLREMNEAQVDRFPMILFPGPIL